MSAGGGNARLGRFLLDRILGSGGFATVWLAYDETLDAWVAIKLLADNWSHDAEFRRRFTEEARVLWRLESAHIVRVYGVDETPEGQPYFVMEYADSANLADRMKARLASGERYSVDEALAISLDIAQGLVDAQKRDIVHRDLKPSNVLFKSADGGAERLLLADFGIARSLEDAGAFTIAAGTPHYMAPEQSEGRADKASDVYSAAVILFELLAGRVPFPYQSAGQVIRAQITEQVPSISALRAETPEWLVTILARGLSSDPGQRQSSAEEWRRDLTNGSSAPRVASGPGAGATLGPEDLAALRASAADGGLAAGAAAADAGLAAGAAAGLAAGAAAGATLGPEDLAALRAAGPVAAAPPSGPAGPPSGPPSKASPGPPAGAPPGAAPPGAAGPGPTAASRDAQRRRNLIRAGILVLLLLGGTIAAISVFSSGTANAEIFRMPATSTGAHAYTPSVTTGKVSVSPQTLPFLKAPNTIFNVPAAAPANSVPSYLGGTPGLYGGTRQLTVCDAKAVVSFLQANPAKAAAWAAVEGISVGQVGAYIGSLTDSILRSDTQVTNHGFVNGRATTIPEVLQAGTAVLIDQFGVPRARCYCGNPLTPPVALKVTPKFVGPSWPGFNPKRINVIQAAPSPVPQFTLVDVNSGIPFLRQPGPNDSQDTNAPPNALAGSPFAPTSSSAPPASTTTTVAPTTTAPPATTAPTVAPTPVDITHIGAVSASSEFSSQFPSSNAVDGNVGTSWFSAGASDGPVSTFTWQAPGQEQITGVTIIGNEHDSDPSTRDGFGYGQTEIKILNSAGNVVFDQTYPGSSDANRDIHASMNVTGQTVRLLLMNRENSTCGGFAELTVTGVQS